MKSNLWIGILLLALAGSNSYAQTNASAKTVKMKEFSFLVRVPVTYSKEQAAAAGPKWNALLDQWKADSIYITSFAFPGESYVVVGKEKSVKKETVVSDNQMVVSNIFLRAKDFDSAVELSKVFPVLEYGGTVEVRAIKPRAASTN